MCFIRRFSEILRNGYSLKHFWTDASEEVHIQKRIDVFESLPLHCCVSSRRFTFLAKIETENFRMADLVLLYLHVNRHLVLLYKNSITKLFVFSFLQFCVAVRRRAFFFSFRSSHLEVLYKIDILKFLQNSQKNTCVGVPLSVKMQAEKGLKIVIWWKFEEKWNSSSGDIPMFSHCATIT